MADLDFWERIQGIFQIIMVVGVIVIGAYYVWKTRKSTSKDDAIKAYKDVIDAYTLKMDEFKKDLDTMKEENKGLHAQVNQLIGENKALKNVKPSIVFEDTVKTILTTQTEIMGEIKTLSTHQSNLREDFVKHGELDNTRFGSLLTIADNNQKMLMKICPQ